MTGVKEELVDWVSEAMGEFGDPKVPSKCNVLQSLQR